MNQNTKFNWGLKPSPTLEKFIHLIPKGKALDIGAGEGRDSFFLAKNGFEVEAIDKDAENLDKCKNFTQQNNLFITTEVCDVREFKFKENEYSLVIAKNILVFLKKSEVETIIEKIKKSLIPNGFIYLSVFSTKEPSYQKIKDKGLKEVEKNTFYLPKPKTFRHYFTEKELERLFKDFKVIYLKESKIDDPGHRATKPHIHYVIGFLAQKIKTAA